MPQDLQTIQKTPDINIIKLQDLTLSKKKNTKTRK